MPTNSSTTRGAGEPLGEENLFAPTPVWARTTTRKRRGFGAASRPAPAPVVTDRPMRTEDARADAAADTTAVYETRRARGGVNGGAVAAGVVALAAIGGIAWYASQPHDRGMAELTPGATATSQTALDTSAPTAAQLPQAATPAASSAATQRTVTTTRASTPASTTTTTRRTTTVATRTPAHRARPAASASDEGENASATAPMMAAPQPVPMTRQTPSTATAPMSVNPAPAAPATPSEPMSSPASSGAASGTTTSDPASSTTP